MRVLIFGASGMVGQGALRECVRDAAVVDVLCVGRSPIRVLGGKVRELVCRDLFDLAGVESQLVGFDACFFCLGVSSGDVSEAEYRRLTFELTLSVARVLVRLNPGMVFEFVSGAGTDSTEKGKTMWARVKGQTENALLGMGFARAYMFRPGVIQPLDGIRSKTKSYRLMYAVLGPLLPLARRMFPKYVTSTQEVGRAMIAVARDGYAKGLIEAEEIRAIATGAG